jgi:ABC-type Mn2+/Zn2+ transport system ATPase subunit
MLALEAKNLSYGVPGGRLLQENLSFQVAAGQVLLISGSNGCGKSSLLRVLLGEGEASGGRIVNRIASDRIDYLPQLENTEVHLPLTLEDVLSLSQRGPLDEDRITQYHLVDRAHLGLAWNHASGGERKRVLLTRSLLKNPGMLVFDEPMNHLDEKSRAAVTRAIAQFLKSSTDADPKAVVMVCHQGLTAEEASQLDVVELKLECLSRGRLHA